MAINETIASGKYRQCIDEINKIWKRYSLWNKASDTECEDGQTVEEKVGTIKGITTDENVTESGYAADMIALNELRAQLYSDIQNLQNDLSALDTRVTNAINGGDLSAPFEMNFLITPYSNSISNVENSATLDANTANKLQYTAYATYNNETGDYDAKITRTYSTAVKIPDSKCILTFSGACLVRSGYAEHIDNNLKVEVLNSAGSKLAETSAINSTGNTTVQLSLESLKGQTVKLRVSMMSDGYPWRPRGFVISKLMISN